MKTGLFTRTLFLVGVTGFERKDKEICFLL